MANQSPCPRHRVPLPPGRSSMAAPNTSADDAAGGAETLRQTLTKMPDAADSNKTNPGPVRRVTRRTKVSSSFEVKDKDKSDINSQERGDISKTSEIKRDRNAGSRRTPSKNGQRRPPNCTCGHATPVQPVIRVKVAPSATKQSTPNAPTKVDGDNDRVTLPDGNSAEQSAAPKRCHPRRKARTRADELEGPLPPGLAFGTSALAAPKRISPLHCAFLDALKEWSPRLVAALSATNEAAFLNAMWSCFWRGYRAGFHASVQELEASSGLCMKGSRGNCRGRCLHHRT